MVLTDVGQVERHLGITLTAPQVAEATLVCDAVDTFIAVEYGVSISVTPVVDEFIDPGPSVYLRRAPVTSVQSVTVYGGVGSVGTVLTLNTDYEVRDLTTGRLALGVSPLSSWYGMPRLVVVYTPNATPARHHQLAATMLAAHWLRRMTEGILPGIKSYSVGGDISVTYADMASAYGVPPDVEQLLRAGRPLVLV